MSGHTCVMRIELTAARRRHLGAMAIAADMSPDAFASALLATLIDEDRRKHDQEIKIPRLRGVR